MEEKTVEGHAEVQTVEGRVEVRTADGPVDVQAMEVEMQTVEGSAEVQTAEGSEGGGEGGDGSIILASLAAGCRTPPPISVQYLHTLLPARNLCLLRPPRLQHETS